MKTITELERASFQKRSLEWRFLKTLFCWSVSKTRGWDRDRGRGLSFLKKECCFGVRVRVRVRFFPLSCNFYVTDVNFTRVNKIKARFKLSSLNVKLSDQGSNCHVYERPASYIASILFANENFTREPT